MSSILKNRKILICVSSGIALYKTVGLVSSLRKLGAEIKVVMTPNAKKMVSEIVFSSVGSCSVYADMFDINNGWIPHTDLSNWAELLIVTPATANSIAKINHGIADNLLLAVCIAFQGKKMLVPTMNIRMYENTTTQENLKSLQEKGWEILEPGFGHLACGDIGPGRYPENDVILQNIEYMLYDKILENHNVLVTAGPTREKVDSVRYVSNRSSGKMGYALAKAFRYAGSSVNLVSGPVNLEPPAGVEKTKVETTFEMGEAVDKYTKNADIIVMTAAISDYSPKNPISHKIKKSEENLVIEMERTRDIISTIKRKKDSILVGFCAEDKEIEDRAVRKLKHKNLDIVFANDISKEGIGFDSEYNELLMITKDGRKEKLPRLPKDELAFKAVKLIADYIKSAV
ncbi:MAG: bifunctional phosphopantothenoylcysteine decarboxylase/phosphopantothenate--cysteine ligase CoaBC [Thermotogota bacterium]|nr:bifunctional phosphopantothenoylcysteine decarboxylase/phosphopantothenate--cysteine ligase CoaBC [Thermotogota bacterium]